MTGEENVPMSKLPGTQTTAIPTTRPDGTVYFKHVPPLGEQICHWTLASLWVLAPVLAVAALWL
ncbi:MAG TPA: hypothetical protein VHI32_00115 [Burkholderiales bacterium]|jgi:hypothetical protein|nr:hypothetical protein [Burkholderiales bacterium]